MAKTVLMYVVNELCRASTNFLVRDLVANLDTDRYECHVGCVKGDGNSMSAEVEAAGATVASFCRSGGSQTTAIPALARYMRDHGVQIVHTHVLKADLAGAVAARLAGVPLLVSTKHNTEFLPGQGGWLLRRTFHWPSMYLPDHLITVSESMRREILARMHFHPDRVTAIRNGIDPRPYQRQDARERYRAELGLADDAVAVCYLGRLVAGKGIELLLRVAKGLEVAQPNLRYIIAGDGGLRGRLEEMARDLSITDRVTFTGFRQDVPEILSACDIFALPSIAEGLPLSLLEAMAAGKVAVVSALGGNMEVVEDGVNGVLLPQNDEQALAATLVALAADPGRRAALGRAARETVWRHFSTERMVGAYDRVYQSLLARRGLLGSLSAPARPA